MKHLFFQKLWGSFLGDCSIVDEWLSDKPVFHPFWFICHYLNIFLRSVSQVCCIHYDIFRADEKKKLRKVRGYTIVIFEIKNKIEMRCHI